MMKAEHAVYPGTFDPPTLGHLDILSRAARIFPRVTLAIAEGGRNTLFTVRHRVELAREALAAESIEAELAVVPFEGLLIDLMQEIDAHVAVRGLRRVADMEHEEAMAAINRHMRPGFEVLLFFARPELAMISGTYVRDVARCQGELGGLVTANVARALRERFAS